MNRQIIVGPTSVDVTDRTVSWTSGMAIDLDGAPNAYAPVGSGLVGLDNLANAGSIGKWWGLACTDGGAPFVQLSGPYKGYYISTTALANGYYPVNDRRRYVDSTSVPYVSVPRVLLTSAGVRKGDLCLVSYGGLNCAAIVADVGPSSKIGEGSAALAKALGIRSDRHGGCDDGVSWVVYLGSAANPPWPRQQSDIDAAVAQLSIAS